MLPVSSSRSSSRKRKNKDKDTESDMEEKETQPTPEVEITAGDTLENPPEKPTQTVDANFMDDGRNFK